MRYFESGFQISQGEGWDFTSLFICPECIHPSEGIGEYEGFYQSDLNSMITCENKKCLKQFRVIEGLFINLGIEDPFLVNSFFNKSYTAKRIILFPNTIKTISFRKIGMRVVTKVIIVSNTDPEMKNFKHITEISDSNLKLACIGEIGSSDDVTVHIFGEPDNDFHEGIDLWKKLISKTKLEIEYGDYSYAIILAKSSYEVFLENITRSWLLVARNKLKPDTISSITDNNRNITKFLNELTRGKFSFDTPLYEHFIGSVVKPRNEIVHDGKFQEYGKFQAKDALITTVMVIKHIFDLLPKDIKIWTEFLIWRSKEIVHQSSCVFNIDDYWKFVHKEIHVYGIGRNADAVGHQNFLETKKGFKLIFNRILNGIFGKCSNCKVFLIPIGSDKPYDTNTGLYCLKCSNVVSELEIDGGYYGKKLLSNTWKPILKRKLLK